MPRLFTALEIPSELAQRLSLVRGALNGARWIDTENYHITLRFIGDVDFRSANEIADRLEEIRARPLRLEIESLDVFGGNRPRSLIARINRDPWLFELQKLHERIAQLSGLKPEGRKFSPHVTLARLKQTKPDDVAHFLTQQGGIAVQPFDVSRFVLMSSKSSKGGGPYIVEESYEFAA